MKVIVVTSSLDTKGGGWGRYSKAVVDELIASGVEVTVCSEGVTDAPYPVFPISHLTSVATFVRNMFVVRRAARDADVVHAFDGWPYGVYGWFATLGTSKKLFINGVGTYSVAPLYSPVTGWLLRRAYAKAKKIFCGSDYTKQQIAVKTRISDEKLLVVHMGVQMLPVLSEGEREIYRKTYGIDGSARPVILTVGAIKERKGQLDTLKAIEILKSKHPEILYLVVGDARDPYVQDLKTYAVAHGLERNVMVVPDADDRALSFFYSICDVFALNSNTDEIHHHFEGFGLVIIEAHQFGKPVVGSRGCGIEDAIQDGKTGFLTDQRDPKDIADHITRILENPDFFSENAKVRYRAFDWGKTVAAYTQWY